MDKTTLATLESAIVARDTAAARNLQTKYPELFRAFDAHHVPFVVDVRREHVAIVHGRR
jgi:hypothetical protein